jgi:hypothetical protein
MTRLSRFSAVDDFPIAEKHNDHRIKMYKGLRRGGLGVAQAGLPARAGISPDRVTTPVSATGGGQGPKPEEL